MTEPEVYDVEVTDGRMEPLSPDYSIITAAKWWGITPMQYLEMPLYWAHLGGLMRTAEIEVQNRQGKRKKR